MQQGNQRRSPALDFKSEWYPKSYNNKVPKRIKMCKSVRSELPTYLDTKFRVALIGKEYACYVNSHGAVSAFSDGSMLGLRSGEFEVIEFHS